MAPKTLSQDRSFFILLRSVTLAIFVVAIVKILQVPHDALLAVSQFAATLFLNALSMSVLPLILFSSISGAARFAQKTTSARSALSILAVFASNTFLAAVIAAASFNIVEFITPTAAIYKASNAQVAVSYSLADMILKIFPPNIFAALSEQNMVGMICFSLFFGSALGILSRTDDHPSSTLLLTLESAAQCSLVVVRYFVSMLPYAVVFFVLNLGLSLQLAHLYRFKAFLSIFFLSIVLYWALGLTILAMFLRRNPFNVLSSLKLALVNAATTSSSAAALPDLMTSFEQTYNMPRTFVRFVTPLGTILNMGASSLFICGTVLHLADLYGYPMAFADQFSLILLSWITSWGIAGVPSASLISLVMLLSILGIPKDALALILGFDRVFDIARTVSNVFGNAVSVFVISALNHKATNKAIE